MCVQLICVTARGLTNDFVKPLANRPNRLSITGSDSRVNVEDVHIMVVVRDPLEVDEPFHSGALSTSSYIKIMVSHEESLCDW
jgi:hypothetical protein